MNVERTPPVQPMADLTEKSPNGWTESQRTASAGDPARAGSRTLTVGGVLMGMGLGGFVDGVVIHQILQWHHMGTGHSSFPGTTVSSLEENTLWDGLFHAGTWVLTVIGLLLVWRALRGGRHATWRTLVGLLLTGWGAFNLVEGIVNHHLLQIHHVRDDLGGPLTWDLAFLLFGALLLLGGIGLQRRDAPTHNASAT